MSDDRETTIRAICNVSRLSGDPLVDALLASDLDVSAARQVLLYTLAAADEAAELAPTAPDLSVMETWSPSVRAAAKQIVHRAALAAERVPYPPTTTEEPDGTDHEETD
jgi:hypothetical protein